MAVTQRRSAFAFVALAMTGCGFTLRHGPVWHGLDPGIPPEVESRRSDEGRETVGARFTYTCGFTAWKPFGPASESQVLVWASRDAVPGFAGEEEDLSAVVQALGAVEGIGKALPADLQQRLRLGVIPVDDLNVFIVLRDFVPRQDGGLHAVGAYELRSVSPEPGESWWNPIHDRCEAPEDLWDPHFDSLP